MARYFLLALLSIWMALPALAQSANDWTKCNGTASGVTTPNVGRGDVHCYEFDEGTLVNARVTFKVRPSVVALACLEPDKNSSTLPKTVRVDIEKCVNLDGVTPGANTCATMLAASLGGAGGDSSSQTRCIRLTNGTYQMEVTTAVVGGEDAVFEIRGED